jgi:hypothetical protein
MSQDQVAPALFNIDAYGSKVLDREALSHNIVSQYQRSVSDDVAANAALPSGAGPRLLLPESGAFHVRNATQRPD